MDTFYGFRKVGKYEISNICLQSYPCQHSIKNCENGETIGLISGDKIYSLLKKEGLTDEHFDGYAKFIIQSDFPSPKVIEERRENTLKIQQASEKREKEEGERHQIVNKYKASSRLEQLKNKNNIK